MEQHGHPDGANVRSEHRSWKTYAIGAALLVFAIFCLQNSQSVEVNFLFAKTNTPLILALLATGAVGALVGFLTPRVRRHERGESGANED